MIFLFCANPVRGMNNNGELYNWFDKMKFIFFHFPFIEKLEIHSMPASLPAPGGKAEVE